MEMGCRCAFAVSGVQCSIRSPYTGAVTKQSLLANVAARAAERARLIEIDNAEKHAAWIATLDALRTKKKNTAQDVDDAEDAELPPSPIYHYSQKEFTLQNFLDLSTPVADVDTAKAVWWNGAAQNVPGTTPVPPAPAPVAATPPAPPKPAAKKKPAPPKPAPVAVVPPVESTPVAAPAPTPVKKKAKATKKPTVVPDIVQEVRPGDFPVPEKASPKKAAPAAAPAKSLDSSMNTAAAAAKQKKSSTTQETDASLSGLKKLGADLLDAIVDGVEVESTTSTSSSTPIDGKAIPDNVVAAVEGGKLKTLTVTKLRRMLSECGLKTSGRKSELIARLTSFVRS